MPEEQQKVTEIEKLEEDKFAVSDLDSNYESILERAIDLIPNLEKDLSDCANKLTEIRAILTIKYKENNRDIRTALIDSDPQVVELKDVISKISAIHTRWREAQITCRSIYKAKTQQ